MSRDKACINHKYLKHEDYSPRWLAPEVVEILAAKGIVATADEVESLCARNQIKSGSSSDSLCSDHYADIFVEYTRLVIDSTAGMVHFDHYGLVSFHRRPATLEDAERLAAELPTAIVRWKSIDAAKWYANHLDRWRRYEAAKAELGPNSPELRRWLDENPYPTIAKATKEPA